MLCSPGVGAAGVPSRGTVGATFPRTGPMPGSRRGSALLRRGSAVFPKAGPSASRTGVTAPSTIRRGCWVASSSRSAIGLVRSSTVPTSGAPVGLVAPSRAESTSWGASSTRAAGCWVVSRSASSRRGSVAFVVGVAGAVPSTSGRIVSLVVGTGSPETGRATPSRASLVSLTAGARAGARSVVGESFLRIGSPDGTRSVALPLT